MNEPQNAADFLPPHLTAERAEGARRGVPCLPHQVTELDRHTPETQEAVFAQAVAMFDAPPYTLETLDLGGEPARMAVGLLCAQSINAVTALAERLLPQYGTKVAPHEAAALAALRRDLAVHAERMRELVRSVAGVTAADMEGAR